MDDPVIFAAFAIGPLGVNVKRAQQELISYISTFRQLMEISEGEIDEFIKQVHSGNSGRAAGQRIIYNPSIAANLKALSFTLKDRSRCNALYDANRLALIDQAILTLMKTYCSQAI